MDDEWQNWLRGSINSGCDLGELIKIMKENGFTDQAIGQGIAVCYQMLPAQHGDPSADYAALANIKLTQMSSPSVRKVESDDLQIYEVDNFMSATECKAVVEEIKKHAVQSAVGSVNYNPSVRTSSTCMLGRQHSELIQSIDRRISECLGINLLYSDEIEGQHYKVGQEFKPHYDYFTQGIEAHKAFTKISGNRTWTFMVYLNDNLEGGDTFFSKIDQTFTPKQGRAVAWNNLTSEGKTNPHSMHAGLPVISGEKFVITKWFRERAAVSMLLD